MTLATPSNTPVPGSTGQAITVNVRYFASIREAMGMGGEVVFGSVVQSGMQESFTICGVLM